MILFFSCVFVTICYYLFPSKLGQAGSQTHARRAPCLCSSLACCCCWCCCCYASLIEYCWRFFQPKLQKSVSESEWKDPVVEEFGPTLCHPIFSGLRDALFRETAASQFSGQSWARYFFVGLFPEVNFTTPSWAETLLDTSLVWPGRAAIRPGPGRQSRPRRCTAPVRRRRERGGPQQSGLTRRCTRHACLSLCGSVSVKIF